MTALIEPTPGVQMSDDMLSRPDRRAIAALSALAAALSVAFVYVPRTLVGGPSELTTATQQAFSDFWRIGAGSLTPQLSELVAIWGRFHAVKALAAALLLGVLLTLATVLWRRRQRRATVVIAVLAAGALVLLVANLQGWLAPFSSLMSMFPVGTDAPTAVDVQLGLSQPSPPLAVMLDEFAWYHAALAVVAIPVGLALAAPSVALWKRFKTLGAFSMVLALLFLGLGMVNALTASDPAPALLGFFQGQ
ncbi:hypothetical protein ACNHUS_18595 [Actinomycetes bacterium M1A6_2h]